MKISLKEINRRFERIGAWIVRWRWLNLALFALILLAALKGLPMLKMDTSNDNWFVEGSEIRLMDDMFEEIFGNNDYAAVLVEVDDVFDPEVLAAMRELSDEVEAFTPLADEVLSLTNLEFSRGFDGGIDIDELIPDPIPTDPDELEALRLLALAKPAIAGKLLSHDSKMSWIMLRLKPFPDDWSTDEEYLAFIQKVAEEYPQYFKDFDSSKPQAPEMLIGHVFMQIVKQEKYEILNPLTSGMPMISYEKRAWVSAEMPRLMGLALLFSIVILAITLRTFRGVVFPVICGLSAMLIVFGIQGYMGYKIDPSVITMPMLLGFAVAVGYAIHIVTFFKRGLREGRAPREAAAYAVEESGWPVMFTALTTIGALMSFLFVEVPILRWIGLTSAAIVGVTFILTIVILPSLLSFGRLKRVGRSNEQGDNPLFSRLMNGFNDWVMAHPNLLLALVGLVIVAGIWGLTRLEVAFDIERTMGPKVGYVKRMLHVSETEVGALYSYEIGINFPDKNQAKDPQNLRKFEALEKEVKSLPLTKKTSSVLDIVKDLNQVLNEGDADFYKLPELTDIPEYRDFDGTEEDVHAIETQMIAQTMLLYENAGGAEAEKWIDYDGKWLHMQVDIHDYNAKELKRELDRIEQKAQELYPDAAVLIAGTAAEFTVMQGIVVWGQIKSFAIALGIITVLLIIVFGSVRTGLIGLIPNIAPALVVGGIMGFIRIPLDMITVTLMPMLLGLAVDDTIHFINHCHLEYERERDYARSIRRTFIVVGPALMTTSIVLVLNFSAYLVSDARFFFNMGILAVAGILSALLTDFTVTPILLKLFKVFGSEENENREKRCS